jgi:hypothetical protein
MLGMEDDHCSIGFCDRYLELNSNITFIGCGSGREGKTEVPELGRVLLRNSDKDEW